MENKTSTTKSKESDKFNTNQSGKDNSSSKNNEKKSGNWIGDDPKQNDNVKDRNKK